MQHDGPINLKHPQKGVHVLMSCRRVSITFVLALSFWLGATPSVKSLAQTPQLSVDASKVIRPLKNFALETNTSIRFVPPRELAGRVEAEYGRPTITRVWLPLDDMWDYRDNSYHFNFEIGQDRYANDKVKSRYDRGVVLPSNVPYYDYLDSFSAHSDYLLLNVRRYEAEVVKGIIPITKWKEVLKTGLLHYKKRYRNLRYIEALNEWHVSIFGGIADKDYYQFYKACYEVVNEINDELKPEIPLEVGGPTVVGKPLALADATGEPQSGNKTLRLYHFFQQYAADPNPRKRLDFVSFHDYELKNDLSAVRNYQSIVRKLLKDFNLREDTPIYVTEIGYADTSPKAELNQHQATGISELFYSVRETPQVHLFPWVLYHEPARQINLTAFISGKTISMTPFGDALKMWSMQRKNEVEVKWVSPLKGLNAVASKDDEALVLQIWNNSANAVSLHVNIASLKSSFGKRVHVQQYRIDSHNNNVLLNPEGSSTFTPTSDSTSNAKFKNQSVSLEPYSLVMWKIQRSDQ